VDYVERGGDALASLSWDAVIDQPTDAYRAQYWNAAPGVNAIPGTSPELERDEEAIDHDWGRRLTGRRDWNQPLRGPMGTHGELCSGALRVCGDG
jgi:hypothetical protein